MSYSKPLPIIIELVYEEQAYISADESNQFKSVVLVFAHFFICYVVYNI